MKGVNWEVVVEELRTFGYTSISRRNETLGTSEIIEIQYSPKPPYVLIQYSLTAKMPTSLRYSSSRSHFYYSAESDALIAYTMHTKAFNGVLNHYFEGTAQVEGDSSDKIRGAINELREIGLSLPLMEESKRLAERIKGL